MKIISLKQSFFVVHSIQSCVYKKIEDKEKREWEIMIVFNGSNGIQVFKTYFDKEEECSNAYEEIRKAVVICEEYD